LLQVSFAACYDLSAQKFFYAGTLASIPPLKGNLCHAAVGEKLI